MVTIEEAERLYQQQKENFPRHHQKVIEGRFKRAVWEGIHVLLYEETFLKLDKKERQQWSMIPMKPFLYWARGPICGYVTTEMDDLETEEDEFWTVQRGGTP